MRRGVVLVAILATFLKGGVSLCVLDNKHGWSVECGLRDSYLLRLKDIGGIKANFDFGFGLGNEDGFPESIKNTAGHHGHGQSHGHARSDDESSRTFEEAPSVPLRPPIRRAVEDDDAPPAQQLRKPVRFFRPTAPPFHLRPPPMFRRRQTSGPNGVRFVRPLRRRHPQRAEDEVHNTQEILIQPGTSPTIVFTHAPAPPSTPSPSNRPTIGPAMGDLLKVDASTPADTDHVPSFAAKMFVVREAPDEFNPPGYKAPVVFPKIEKRVEVPRTQFFCEEQKYLPGIYADIHLGCKVFHLCLPAAMGNTLTSFLCPNMTLFDQSIMQCNYWYHVNCENSPKHYDANLHMALSYRKINAAQLPLTAVRDYNNVALLSHNSEEMKNLRTIPPSYPSITENLALKRIGEVKSSGEVERRMDSIEPDSIPRGPRVLSTDRKEDEDVNISMAKEIEKSKAKRSINFDNDISMRSLNDSPLLLKLYRK